MAKALVIDGNTLVHVVTTKSFSVIDLIQAAAQNAPVLNETVEYEVSK